MGRAGNATGPTGPADALLGELPGRILAASERLAPWLSGTPFEIAPAFRGSRVRWKLECFQATGSFKARGALHKLLALRETRGAAALAGGVVTASSGNHGRATAYGLALLGGRGLVYLPRTVADSKRRALEERYGEVVEVRLVGEDAVEAEVEARAEAERSGRPFVSPYNDPDIIAGQGTVGLEMDRALGAEPLDAVLVPVGGGGLVAGVAGWLRHARPAIRVVGCQPRASAVMAASVAAGRILESGRETPFGPTLADGVAGGVEEGRDHPRALRPPRGRLGAPRRGRDRRRHAAAAPGAVRPGGGLGGPAGGGALPSRAGRNREPVLCRARDQRGGDQPRRTPPSRRGLSGAGVPAGGRIEHRYPVSREGRLSGRFRLRFGPAARASSPAVAPGARP